MRNKHLTLNHIVDFLDQVTAWAKKDNTIFGIALVGSYARNQAKDDSDIDLIILTNKHEKYLMDYEWLKNFGRILNVVKAEYGAVTSLHVTYQSGYKVEFGVALPSWASIPVDQGTKEVITDGIVILYDPGKLFLKLMEALKSNI